MTSVSVCFEVNNAAQLYANVSYFTDLSPSLRGGRIGGPGGMHLHPLSENSLHSAPTYSCAPNRGVVQIRVLEGKYHEV